MLELKYILALENCMNPIFKHIKTPDRKNVGLTEHSGFRIILSVLIIITLIFIWTNSIQNGTESNAQSDRIVTRLKPIIDPKNKIDIDDLSFAIRKAAHFCEYFLLGAELCLFFYSLKIKEIFGSPFLVLMSAVIDETIQLYHERTSSVTDIILDFCGGLCGICIMIIIVILCTQFSEKRKLRVNSSKYPENN